VLCLVAFIALTLMYKSRHYVFGTAQLSMFTPVDLFASSVDLEQKEDAGFKYMATQRVIITGLVRDVENRIPLLLRKVYGVGRHLGQWKLLIVENDSKDRTRELLLDAAKQDPEHIEVLGCGINVNACSMSLPKTIGHEADTKRITKMAMLRNVYMDRIEEAYSDWNYIMMWDLDIIGTVYSDGIATSFSEFESDPQIDAICGNGIHAHGFSNFYYDTYAHEDLDENFHVRDKLWHGLALNLWKAKYDRGDPLHKCKSCFGGFTIYRMSSLHGIRYHPPGEALECEHVLFNRQLKNVYVNPSMINLLIENP
jgi:hypothetical protein